DESGQEEFLQRSSPERREVLQRQSAEEMEMPPEDQEEEEPPAEEPRKEELTLQTKALSHSPAEADPTTADLVARSRSGGRSLPEPVRAFFEPRFGYDFSRVRVHTDDRAAEAAHAVRALAFTVGSDVVFGAGQYAPETEAGRRLLAHELTHV